MQSRPHAAGQDHSQHRFEVPELLLLHRVHAPYARMHIYLLQNSFAHSRCSHNDSCAKVYCHCCCHRCCCFADPKARSVQYNLPHKDLAAPLVGKLAFLVPPTPACSSWRQHFSGTCHRCSSHLTARLQHLYPQTAASPSTEACTAAMTCPSSEPHNWGLMHGSVSAFCDLGCAVGIILHLTLGWVLWI
jgi:hypothetical protein